MTLDMVDKPATMEGIVFHGSFPYSDHASQDGYIRRWANAYLPVVSKGILPARLNE